MTDKQICKKLAKVIKELDCLMWEENTEFIRKARDILFSEVEGMGYLLGLEYKLIQKED